MSDLFSFVSCQILPTKLISKAHVGFFCLSRVKFYAQNLNLTCPIWFFFSCQILCKTLISISPSEFCLFVSCQILPTKSQASAIFLKLLNSVRRVKFYERVNLDLTCRTCSCQSCVKFPKVKSVGNIYEKVNLNLTCRICFRLSRVKFYGKSKFQSYRQKRFCT